MNKRVTIYILSSITLFLLLVGSFFATIFSSFGNGLIKEQIQKVIDENSPQKLTIKKFTLTPSSAHIYIDAKDGSFFSTDANFSLFRLYIMGTYKAEVVELANYKKVTEIPLKGSLATTGEFKSDLESVDIKGVLNVAEAMIDYDVNIEDKALKKAIIKSESIKIDELLNLFSQPKVATGSLKLDSDITPLSDGSLRGVAKVKISSGIAYKEQLKEAYSIEVPKSVDFSGDLEADIKGDILTLDAKIDSSLLNINSNDMVVHLDRNSFDGEFSAKLEPIKTPYAEFKEPLYITGSAKSDDKRTKIDAKTEYFKSPINLTLNLESLTPKDASITALSLSLAEVLIFVNQNPFATGLLELSVDIEGLDSKKPKGTISSKGSNIEITKRSLKDFFQIESAQKSIEGAFALDANIVDGITKGSVELDTNVADIRSKSLTYDLHSSSLKTEFDVDIDDLKALEFLIGTALYGDIKISNSLSVEDEKIRYRAHSNTLGGELDVDFDNYILKVDAKHIDASKLDEMLGLKKVFKSGQLELQSRLLLDKNSEDMLKTVDGELSLRGKRLLLAGYNIDTIVDNFKSTQSISLLDVGAIVVAGPIGLAATKGVSAGGMAFGSAGGDTLIQELLVRSTIESGLAKADDVAFSTNSNLIAVNGGLQLWNQEFKSFWIAVVDKHGCSEFKQRVGGTLSDPEIIATQSSFEIVKNVAKSVGSIFSDSADALVGILGGEEGESSCDKFYRGEVKYPK